MSSTQDRQLSRGALVALVFGSMVGAGIYAYATAGFGSYLGFVPAFGYWIACCLADVACLVLIKATLG